MVVVKMANLAGTLLGRCISDGRREDGQAQSVSCSLFAEATGSPFRRQVGAGS